jgi:hypothetical protein
MNIKRMLKSGWKGNEDATGDEAAGKTQRGHGEINQGTRLIVVLMTGVLMGCMGSYTPENANGKDPDGGMELVNDLFEETGMTAEGETVTRLHTNDVRYWSERGYTLWTVWGEEEPEDGFVDRTVGLSKGKGYAGAGYGLVICQGERAAGEDGENALTMLTVMINNEGEYTIGKVVGGRYESLVQWTRNEALWQGAGTENEVTVRAEGDMFKVEINGDEVTSFADDKEPKHYGGRNGYIVVIAPMDRFPGEEVDVRFREKK